MRMWRSWPPRKNLDTRHTRLTCDVLGLGFHHPPRKAEAMEAKYVQTQTVYSFELSEDAQHVAEGDGGPMFRPTMMLVEVTGNEVTSVALSGPRQFPTAS